MRLSELISGLDAATPFKPPRAGASADPDVRRVVADSRRVQPGDAFCAIAGHESDGHRYVEQAVAAGAVAVFAERPVEANVPVVEVADGRRALARLAHRCLGDPSRNMTVIGVTGTNGKTTTTYLLESVLQAAGRRCGVLGTIVYRLGPGCVVDRPTHVTTPGADELAEMFARMLAAGTDHVAMEVSSHALDQERVAEIDFDAAVFTNLTGDHADYHPTPEHYLDAKARLFRGLRPDAAAIVNRDAAPNLTVRGQTPNEIIAACTPARVTWFGLSAAADVSGQVLAINTQGSRFRLSLPDAEPREVNLPLIGRHNVSNSLSAAAAAWRLGIAPDAIVAGLEGLRAVPGRLQPVAAPDGSAPPVTVLVDYAHTDDALDNVLSAVRPLVGRGRLIVVFGCGGDRDAGKRPRMAAVAEHWADAVVVTSDNPRSEPPEAIIDQIMAGFSQGGSAKVTRQPDRRAAIERAIALADPGDLVLIAGKGHEDYQILGRQKVHFDDREVAAEALAKRFK